VLLKTGISFGNATLERIYLIHVSLDLTLQLVLAFIETSFLLFKNGDSTGHRCVSVLRPDVIFSLPLHRVEHLSLSEITLLCDVSDDLLIAHARQDVPCLICHC